MPVLNIETNQSIPQQRLPGLLAAASKIVAEQLGKPEAYVMVRFNQNPTMLFAGSDDPLAFLQLKSIGLRDSATAELSAMLCGFIEDELAVPRSRIYIEFIDAPRKMWGYNGTTF